MKVFPTAAIIAVSLMLATSAHAAGNFEKIDMVKEGIDLKEALVSANSSGYNGYEKDEHTFLVRVFAKGKGNNHIFAAGIGNKSGMSQAEVTAGDWLFRQTAAKGTEGWGVYKKSISLKTKMSKIEWYKSPIQACKDNLAKELSKGKAKSWVLNREWTVQAHALIRFYAGAESKGKVKKGKTGAGQTREYNIAYPISVRCREAL
jgi:hypothetical protein